MKIPIFSPYIYAPLLFILLGAVPIRSQAGRTASDLYTEVDKYQAQQTSMLMRQGKAVDRDSRDQILSQRKSLAKKHAAELAIRPELQNTDLYFLGRLYSIAENDKETLGAMKKFVAQRPPEENDYLLQSALSFVVVLSSKYKQMPAAEEAFERWSNGHPLVLGQKPVLQDHLATGYYKDGQYEQSVKHSQAAFDLLKTIPAKTFQEKRNREQVYMNLVEMLALGYKKIKDNDRSLNVLAEARAQSLSLPSADLYRKVMTFVEGGGFSEKKLMQKTSFYLSSEPAPEFKVKDWIGQDPVSLEDLRGKVILLDFWATWCGPCIATFPRLRDWHKKYSGSDFVIIGVTKYYGEQSNKRMTPLQELDFLGEFKRKHKLPYGFAIADPDEASWKYGITAFPSAVLLDRRGIVRYIGIGAGTEESENLEDTIKVLLKEERIAAATVRNLFPSAGNVVSQ